MSICYFALGMVFYLTLGLLLSQRERCPLLANEVPVYSLVCSNYLCVCVCVCEFPSQFVRKQVSMLKQGVASLEGMLPTIEKKMSKYVCATIHVE